MLRYLSLILIFITLSAGNGFAIKLKPAPKQKAVLRTDTSTVTVRYFNKDALNKYSKQPEFKYTDEVTQPSWWERFWHWFWQWLGHLFDFSKIKHARTFFSALGLLVEYLIILGAAAALVFFILKLVGIDTRNIFSRKPLPADLPYSESLENIHEINFDNEIEKAVAQHNYRLAVRMLYLKCLKQLSDATLISWRPEKTNSAYVNELTDNNQRTAFKQLTTQFEYVWYGEFFIDGSVYKDINFMFQKFNKDLA